MRRSFVWAIIPVLVLFFLAFAGLAVPVDFIMALVLGWVFYLRRVLPQVVIARDGVVTGVLCLALFLAGSHTFLGWLYGQVKAEAEPDDPLTRRWRPRWTLALGALM